MTVVMAGKVACSPIVSRASARRSETSAASTRLAIGRLSTFHPLEGVKAAGSADLGGLHRLPIHDHDARAFRTAGMDACQPVDLALEPNPNRKLSRQLPALATSAQQVEYRVDHSPTVDRRRRPKRFCASSNGSTIDHRSSVKFDTYRLRSILASFEQANKEPPILKSNTLLQ